MMIPTEPVSSFERKEAIRMSPYEKLALLLAILKLLHDYLNK